MSEHNNIFCTRETAERLYLMGVFEESAFFYNGEVAEHIRAPYWRDYNTTYLCNRTLPAVTFQEVFDSEWWDSVRTIATYPEPGKNLAELCCQLVADDLERKAAEAKTCCPMCWTRLEVKEVRQ